MEWDLGQGMAWYNFGMKKETPAIDVREVTDVESAEIHEALEDEHREQPLERKQRARSKDIEARRDQEDSKQTAAIREMIDRTLATKKEYEKRGIEPELLGDFVEQNVRFDEQGRMKLSAKEQKQLQEKSQAFFEEVKNSKVATSKGYKVAAAYDAQIQGWTTRSQILEVAGKRMFALCSYPASWIRRRTDRLMERFSGDRMRKPKPKDWKRIVESRNSIPVLAGTPENMVVMPYIESMNAYDLFAHQKDIKDFGPFGWADGMSVENRMELLGPIAGELHKSHEKGITRGEAILPNVILTKEQKPILIDPETTYEGIDVEEQKAMDLRNLIVSSCGALARAEGFTDFSQVISKIVEGYGDPNIYESLLEVCERPMSWRQRFFFNIFTKFRVGASDLDEFERVRAAIVEYLGKPQGKKKAPKQKTTS